RHTRFSRDWSSDVCSSDLAAIEQAGHVDVAIQRRDLAFEVQHRALHLFGERRHPGRQQAVEAEGIAFRLGEGHAAIESRMLKERSEERRVGKEWRMWRPLV